MLNQKGRIELSESIHQYLKELENHYPVLPLQAPIAAEAFQLDLPQADPFDRVIVATARYHRLPLITRDAEITVSGLVEVIW